MNISLYNPWKDDIADVAAGHSESNRCRGYIPLQDSCSRRYEIKYCDKELEEKSMEIGDDNFKGDWLICIQQNDGIKRDIWDVRPPEGRAFSEVELTIDDSGYEIFSIHGKLWVKGYM
uniref:Uncharacterized protein n=1 Tax=Chenopodium quinoa TaxID=63459 RepID=A0A803M782_CHEQI